MSLLLDQRFVELDPKVLKDLLAVSLLMTPICEDASDLVMIWLFPYEGEKSMHGVWFVNTLVTA